MIGHATATVPRERQTKKAPGILLRALRASWSTNGTAGCPPSPVPYPLSSARSPASVSVVVSTMVTSVDGDSPLPSVEPREAR